MDDRIVVTTVPAKGQRPLRARRLAVAVGFLPFLAAGYVVDWNFITWFRERQTISAYGVVCRGAVVDGYCRDVERLVSFDFSVIRWHWSGLRGTIVGLHEPHLLPSWLLVSMDPGKATYRAYLAWRDRGTCQVRSVRDWRCTHQWTGDADLWTERQVFGIYGFEDGKYFTNVTIDERFPVVLPDANRTYFMPRWKWLYHKWRQRLALMAAVIVAALV